MAEITENDEVLFPELFKVEGSGEVRLVAGYSKEADNWTFPKYLADPVSFSDDVEERLLSPCGELHSFTVVRRSLPEFPVPYALALVDLLQPETFPPCESAQGSGMVPPGRDIPPERPGGGHAKI